MSESFRPTRGALRGRHERGTECGGRESVGRANPWFVVGQAQGRVWLVSDTQAARTTHAKRPVSSTFEGCVRGPEKIIGGHGSRTMKSCGPGASQEVLSFRKSVTSCAGDGGKQEPAHRGEREVSVKTIAQGKPGVPS